MGQVKEDVASRFNLAEWDAAAAPAKRIAKDIEDRIAAKLGIGGAPTRATILPTDPAERKRYPIASGFFDYFPDAIAAVAHVSWVGSEQHNPGKPLFWDRSKSDDEADTCLRHFAARGTLDSDKIRHTAKFVWRALAILQKEIEQEGR
jgi:hypothetical protein